MKSINQIARYTLTAAATLAAGAGSAFAVAPPTVPDTPVAAQRLVYALPFTLEDGYTSFWRAEQPEVTAGWLIVARVDPDLLYPRQSAQPVMYVGEQTAERINHGYEAGMTIAIVPSAVKADGTLALDLSKSMIWFGEPALPESIDADEIAAQKVLAETAGINVLDARSIEQAQRTMRQFDQLGDNETGLRTFADKHDLLAQAAKLIHRYSPIEEELADSLTPRTAPADK